MYSSSEAYSEAEESLELQTLSVSLTKSIVLNALGCDILARSNNAPKKEREMRISIIVDRRRRDACWRTELVVSSPRTIVARKSKKRMRWNGDTVAAIAPEQVIVTEASKMKARGQKMRG